MLSYNFCYMHLLLQPAMDDGVDPSILASLPPSMQLDLLVQVSASSSIQVSFPCLLFFFSEISLWPYFVFNDLAHVVLIVFLYIQIIV